jgi:hypothetical protein
MNLSQLLFIIIIELAIIIIELLFSFLKRGK